MDLWAAKPRCIKANWGLPSPYWLTPICGFPPGTQGLQADNLSDQALLEHLHVDLTAAPGSRSYLRLAASLAALEQAGWELDPHDQPGLQGYCRLQLASAWLGFGLTEAPFQLVAVANLLPIAWKTAS